MQARRVGDYLDSGDLPARDREGESDARLSVRSPHGSRGSVHERRLRESGAPRERVGHDRRTADLRRQLRCALTLPRCARLHGYAVGSEHDLWVEQCEKRGEVTAARGSEEGVDDFPLASEISIGNCGRTLHPATCAARELPCRGRGAPHDGSDLVEGHGEHVVQDEGEPLGGSQRFEHHEQRGTDRVGQ